MSKFSYTYVDPTHTTNACSGSITTPYRTYKNDEQFCSESVDVCKWVANRLGHPVMQLEFNSSSIYAMFEESISEYSLHINNYNSKNWMWEHYGSSTKLSGSQWNDSSASMSTGSIQPTHPHMGITTVLSDQYGESVNVGGDVQVHSGSIVLSSSKQLYDLQSVYSASVAGQGTTTTGKRIEVSRVFNYAPAAITKFYDPYLGSYDQRVMLDSFGFGSYAPASTFILRPISHDITRAQAIESSDYIRKSNYSFEINNNKVRIFPEPTDNDAGNKVWFEYTIKDEKTAVNRTRTENRVTDPSNIPYRFLAYNEINANGRQWVRKFTLALSKELLGIIRSKYASMPLPNGDVTMDGEALKAEGREEKSQLLDELKEFLDSMQLAEKARVEAEQADAQQQILNKSPLPIFIG